MKTFVAICILSVVAVAAWGDSGWGLSGTYWDASDAGDEFGPGARISFEVVPHALLDLRAAYFNNMGTDDNGLDNELQVIPLEGGLTLTAPLGDVVDIYGGIGVGYYLFDGEVTVPGGDTVSADPDDEIGYYGVAGLEITVSDNVAQYGATRVTLFVEFMYRSVTADKVTVSSGGDTYNLAKTDLDGPGGAAGIMIRW